MSELFRIIAPTISKAFYLWTVAAQLLGVGNTETYLAAEFPLPGTPGMNWTACNCFLIRFHTRYMVAAMLQASERGEDLWCNSFFFLCKYTQPSPGKVLCQLAAAFYVFQLISGRTPEAFFIFFTRESLYAVFVFFPLRFYCNRVIFFTCMFFFRLSILKPKF